MPHSKVKRKGPTPPGLKRRQIGRIIVNHDERIGKLEAALIEQSQIIHRQAIVIAEAVFGIQLLIKKKIITREELTEVKKALTHADSILGSGSGVQSEEAGSDVDSRRSSESGLSGGESDRGSDDGNDIEGNECHKKLSTKLEQSNPDSVAG